MLRLAPEYNKGDNGSYYVSASQKFRLPYWDWAADARVPHSCTTQSITVNAPVGPVTIRNPLYSYRWLDYPLNQSLFPGSENWPNETTRSPNANSTYPVDEVNQKLTEQAQSITMKVVSFTPHTCCTLRRTDSNSSVPFPCLIPTTRWPQWQPAGKASSPRTTMSITSLAACLPRLP